MTFQEKLSLLKDQGQELSEKINIQDTLIQPHSKIQLSSNQSDFKQEQSCSTVFSMSEIESKISRRQLFSLRNKLSNLKQERSYPTNISISIPSMVRLIILLDVSVSMLGTEQDIYEGLKDLCQSHQNDNILFSMVIFNDEIETIYKDKPIALVEPRIVRPAALTNLNRALYETIDNNISCNSNDCNLFVTISDGGDTCSEVSNTQVASLIRRHSNKNNHFYFLGAVDHYRPKDVIKMAKELGFDKQNIEVFSIFKAGYRLNFQTISNMLDDLLRQGSIRSNWNEQIKEHYLCLGDSRKRR